MKRITASQKRVYWPIIINILLITMAGLAFFLYWDEMAAKVLFGYQTLSLNGMGLGLFLSIIFLMLGYQCLANTQSDEETLTFLEENTFIEILLASVNFMMSMSVLSLVILMCFAN